MLTQLRSRTARAAHDPAQSSAVTCSSSSQNAGSSLPRQSSLGRREPTHHPKMPAVSSGTAWQTRIEHAALSNGARIARGIYVCIRRLDNGRNPTHATTSQGSYMLDTDTCSCIMKRSNQTVVKRLRAIPVASSTIEVLAAEALLPIRRPACHAGMFVAPRPWPARLIDACL
jgi:hypothetical protein